MFATGLKRFLLVVTLGDSNVAHQRHCIVVGVIKNTMSVASPGHAVVKIHAGLENPALACFDSTRCADLYALRATRIPISTVNPTLVKPGATETEVANIVT